MTSRDPLFKRRILENALRVERNRGVSVPPKAFERIKHWASQLARGVIDKMSESQAEQTFNNEIFGTVLGYEQVGTVNEASLMPKRTGPSGRDTPDFVLGRFDLAARVEEWGAVGEIKNSKTSLDQPQVSRTNKETPVEQAFRYATKGKAGVEWVIVSNFREIRLYKNGYVGAYHSWSFDDLLNPDRLFEFYVLLRPEGILDKCRQPFALRMFEETIAAGRDLTEGFYSLYKIVQEALHNALAAQTASKKLTPNELYGKTHKLLNRILFIAFCEQHPAGLLPRGTLRQTINRARVDTGDCRYWRHYKELFHVLNDGGGIDGVAYNAFNGGLFSPDTYYDKVSLPDEIFFRRFYAGKGKRKSLEIVGIFGFDVYDFAEDLNVQALGAIFEQSLKDTIKGPALVRGRGEIEVTNQGSGGVYYTPNEITAYLVRRALHEAFARIENAVRLHAQKALTRVKSRSGKPLSDNQKEALIYDQISDQLSGNFKIIDPSCGSGAFLVEALDQLHARYDKINRTLAELRGPSKQMSILDLDRQILRQNLYGRDLLPESVEITRLSIWLRTARRGERLESLNKTICAADSLRANDDEAYDIVVGNPPWGAELDGWTPESVKERFPSCGEERDSYAIFAIRAWELLKANGILAFILPNSWLTVEGYQTFRRWILTHFDVLEIINVWKIFGDVNHDAMMLIARKRAIPIDTVKLDTLSAARLMDVKAIGRGQSESGKLRQLAQNSWTISHPSTHGFQFKQPAHRIEAIFTPKIADQLDVIAAKCHKLGEVADVTVGIQVYHHTKVTKEFIKKRGFHSTTKKGSDWYPYIDANDAQRYFYKPSTTQWLQFSDKLRDKRDLQHYAQPRILVQQIFWKRLSATLQTPKKPILYLNTLFSISNSRCISLDCILAFVNSKFVSASYERRSNRLFGDKFPKVSKADLATTPIPKITAGVEKRISKASAALQLGWQQLRSELSAVDAALSIAQPGLSLEGFGEFWLLSEAQFLGLARGRFAGGALSKVKLLTECYVAAKDIVDNKWHPILETEMQLEDIVRQAYGLSPDMHKRLCENVPDPSILWALRK